jgi:hypothetical protein
MKNYKLLVHAVLFACILVCQLSWAGSVVGRISKIDAAAGIVAIDDVPYTIRDSALRDPSGVDQDKIYSLRQLRVGQIVRFIQSGDVIESLQVLAVKDVPY